MMKRMILILPFAAAQRTYGSPLEVRSLDEYDDRGLEILTRELQFLEDEILSARGIEDELYERSFDYDEDLLEIRSKKGSRGPISLGGRPKAPPSQSKVPNRGPRKGIRTQSRVPMHRGKGPTSSPLGKGIGGLMNQNIANGKRIAAGPLPSVSDTAQEFAKEYMADKIIEGPKPPEGSEEAEQGGKKRRDMSGFVVKSLHSREPPIGIDNGPPRIGRVGRGGRGGRGPERIGVAEYQGELRIGGPRFAGGRPSAAGPINPNSGMPVGTFQGFSQEPAQGQPPGAPMARRYLESEDSNSDVFVRGLHTEEDVEALLKRFILLAEDIDEE